MTPEQLDHLRAIDAHLTTLLDLAAKRTPGEWTAEIFPSLADAYNDGGFEWAGKASAAFPGEVGSVWLRSANGGLTGLPGSLETGAGNAAFIAACAGRAEAGWLNTKDEIAYLIAFDKNCRGWQDDNGCAGAAIQHIQHRIAKICERWPLELLTLP